MIGNHLVLFRKILKLLFPAQFGLTFLSSDVPPRSGSDPFSLSKIPFLEPVQSSCNQEGRHDRECDKRLGLEGLDGDAGDQLEGVESGEPGGNRGDLLDVGDGEEGGEENPDDGSQGRQHPDEEGRDPTQEPDRRKVDKSMADHLSEGEGVV